MVMVCQAYMWFLINKEVLKINEEWKPVKGYETYYEVSNLGRVRSLDRTITRNNGVVELKRGRMLKISYNKKVNVYEVHLTVNKQRKCCKLHRLVAEAFIENDDINKTTVNHKDGNRANNTVDNLEWASYSDNLQHAYNVLKRPIVSTTNKKTPCKSIDENGQMLTYESIAEASRATNISPTQIRRLLDKECVNAKYIFEYIK